MSDAAQTLIDSPDYWNLLDRISDTYTQAHQRSPDAPISQTLSDPLSWSHIVELLKIDDPLKRGFYEQQTVREALRRELELSLREVEQ